MHLLYYHLHNTLNECWFFVLSAGDWFCISYFRVAGGCSNAEVDFLNEDFSSAYLPSCIWWSSLFVRVVSAQHDFYTDTACDSSNQW